ncbi:NAD(P)H-binding protein [Streptomyces broussonetiae]|uniref:NAD(P)H-binding protein n=1 Tax=Streptomyces broussonetiae TaxID=2686304 RepID=A0A6I6MVJ5_9ACTN|nr:NAD(P)H-binding protein [Streptomyces broussonetiae]QHA03442.1 NAD(P)H-binding protein [Streptomyces broussonetiae]
MTILVIGARGGVGRHVVEQLLAVGEPVRASVRDPRARADLPAAADVVTADLTRPDTLRRALDGVRRVFLYAPSAGAEGFAAVAAEAGLERVVLLSSGSVLLPGMERNAIAQEHRAVEDVLSAAGLPWVPVRPLVLASNSLRWAESIRSSGTVRLVHCDAVTAPVHERDVAAVAVTALGVGAEDAVAPDPSSAAVLTGPELISQRRQVEQIGQAIGRTLRIEELSPDQAREHYGRFSDPATVEAILQFLALAATGGSPCTPTVRRVLGRPGHTFEQWARDHAADFG